MTAQEYIEHRLNELKISTKIEPFKSEKELVDFIFKTIMSKKFRKYSVNPETNNTVRKAIELNIQNEEPIKIAIPFGSYKLWRLEESPEPDWAELFAMIYYAYWLKPITEVYEPGVWFDFCGDDAILELMNNIPEEDIEKYKRVFRELIDFIRPYLPNNFIYTFSPVGERYTSKEEFLADLNEKIEELQKKGGVEIPERTIEMMKFNIRPREGEVIDFQKNRILHDAYMRVSKRRPHHKSPDKILISATPFGDRTSIPVGTTKNSVVKFQTGVGVLKKDGGRYAEYVLSPSQLEVGHFERESISFPELHGKNFKSV